MYNTAEYNLTEMREVSQNTVSLCLKMKHTPQLLQLSDTLGQRIATTALPLNFVSELHFNSEGRTFFVFYRGTLSQCQKICREASETKPISKTFKPVYQRVGIMKK